MKTLDQTTGIDPQQQTDEDAVMQHVFAGKALDPDVARRVRDRGRRITEEIRATHGLIDDATFQSLLDVET